MCYCASSAGTCNEVYFPQLKSPWIADFCLYLQIIHDVDFLAREVCSDYLGLILQLLSSCSAEVHDSVKESILHRGKSLSDMIPPIIRTIIDAMAEKAAEVLTLSSNAFSF